MIRSALLLLLIREVRLARKALDDEYEADLDDEDTADEEDARPRRSVVRLVGRALVLGLPNALAERGRDRAASSPGVSRWKRGSDPFPEDDPKVQALRARMFKRTGSWPPEGLPGEVMGRGIGCWPRSGGAGGGTRDAPADDGDDGDGDDGQELAGLDWPEDRECDKCPVRKVCPGSKAEDAPPWSPGKYGWN